MEKEGDERGERETHKVERRSPSEPSKGRENKEEIGEETSQASSGLRCC